MFPAHPDMAHAMQCVSYSPIEFGMSDWNLSLRYWNWKNNDIGLGVAGFGNKK